MLNAFFTAIARAFAMTGTFGSYTGTGTVATSNAKTAIGTANVTLTEVSNDTGGTSQYRINAGAWTSLPGSPIAITNGQQIQVRVNSMTNSGSGAEISISAPGVSDSYVVTKL